MKTIMIKLAEEELKEIQQRLKRGQESRREIGGGGLLKDRDREEEI